MTDDEFRGMSGAYVLGALAPEERQAFEDHLEGCARCRVEVLEFSPLPGLMSRVDADSISAEPFDPGPAIARATRQRADRRRSTRRWKAATAIAAVAAIVLAALLAVQINGDDDGVVAFDPGETVELVIDSEFVTEGRMAVNEREWGTRVEVDLIGLPVRTGYHLWAVSTNGDWEIAGTWGPSPEGTCRIVGATSLKTERLDRLVVTSLDQGEELASAR